jgi:membrane protein
VEELTTPEPAQRPRQADGSLRQADSSSRRAARTDRARRSGIDRIKSAHRIYVLLSRTVSRTVVSVVAHDCLNIAQSTAYSAIVALFPALIVAAAVTGLLPDQAPLRFQVAAFFDRVLPPGVSPLLDAYFQNTPNNTHSIRALVGAGFVSFFGASNVMATIMEGLRRARRLPDNCWTFWQKRRRSIELVPLSLVPLAVASLLVVFGHSVTAWLAPSITPDVRTTIYAIALLVRWSVALGASVGLIALIYHLGVPTLRDVADHLGSPVERRATSQYQASLLTPQAWVPTLPGAIVATAMWFLTTLAFGWYVTRFANYSEVYGSLGVVIALLFWLYIISLSVLCGAEFNAHFHSQLGSKFTPPGPAPSEQVSLQETPAPRI